MKNEKSARIFALSFWFFAIISVGSANSQSKDRDNPTRFTSNVISGTISPDKDGDSYYYSFVANPGEVTITLTVESGSLDINQVGFELHGEDEVKMASKVATACCRRSEQAVERVNVTRRQTMLLRINILKYGNSGPGSYRVRVSGAISVGQDTGTASGTKSGLGASAMAQTSTNDRKTALQAGTIPPGAHVVRNTDDRKTAKEFAQEFRKKALNLYEQEKYHEAIESYTVAIGLDPDDERNYSDRADAKFELKDYRGAIADYTEIIRQYSVWEKNKNPMDITFKIFPIQDTYNDRGVAKDRIGDKVGACEDFRKSCNLGGDEGCKNLKKGCN